MKKLIVLSDSHSAVAMLEFAAQYIERQKPDYLVHLGDFRGDAALLEKRLEREVLCVRGNCDIMDRWDREKIFTVEHTRFLAVHGDKFGVKTSLDALSYYAEEQLCQAALFGHTHEPFTGYVGGVLLINPGTLLNGRMCEITVDGKKVDPRIVRV